MGKGVSVTDISPDDCDDVLFTVALILNVKLRNLCIQYQLLYMTYLRRLTFMDALHRKIQPQNHFASPSSFCCIVREVWAQKRFICIFYGGNPRTQNTYLAFVSNKYKNIHNLLLLLQIFECYQDDDHTYLHISYSVQNMPTKVSIHGCITQWNLTP